MIRRFLLALKRLSLTTKHHALGFQTDGWSCGFQNLNIAKLVVEHRGTFSNVPLVPMGAGFVDYVLSIVNADSAVRVVQAPGDDVEGVTELPGPPESAPSTQVEGALSAMEESVQATPTPLEGKEASAEQSVESPEARPQPSMATPTEEDTHPKLLIRGEWHKVPGGYLADASGQLERDQLFINDLSQQLVAELRAACQFNPNPGAKPKSSDTKNGLDLQACILQLFVAGACFVGCIFLRLFGAPTAERIRLLLYWPHTTALVAYNGGTSVGHGPLAMALSGFFFLSLILFPVPAHWMLAMALLGLFS